MDKNTKISKDPQENEIDSNILGDLFRTIADDESKKTEGKEDEVPGKKETLDEKQDPANDK